MTFLQQKKLQKYQQQKKLTSYIFNVIGLRFPAIGHFIPTQTQISYSISDDHIYVK